MTTTSSILAATISAMANVILLAALPFLGYYLYHRLRNQRDFNEIRKRAGLQIGEVRYIGYCCVFALCIVVTLILWSPSLEMATRQGSAFRPFVGLGSGGATILMALLYGILKTGFAEEFLFRGLIAGSLARGLPLIWANIIQSLIFLIPHLLLLRIASELWVMLLPIFAGSLIVGWIRVKSGSIIGPWLVHASVNIVMCLSVATRT